jgi:hypothetical protein
MSEIRVNNIANEAGTGAPTLSYGAQVPTGMGITGAGGINITGVITATSFSGVNTATNASNAFALAGNPNTSVNNLTVLGDQTVGGGLTITGNLTVDGTQTIVNTTVLDVADKTVGIASTTAATDTTADGAGIEIYASSSSANNNKSILWQQESTYFTFSDGIDIPGAVETVGTATTFTQSADKVILSLDAQTGTVFEHNVGTNGSVGIVSLTNFPSAAVKPNSLTTFTVIFTCDPALQGLGNTTGDTGIGTHITLIPYNGVSIANTSAKVSSGSTVTLSDGNDSSTVGDVDFVTFVVKSGTAGTTAFVTKNGNLRFGLTNP